MAIRSAPKSFKHGVDVIELTGRDPDAYLTHQGDVWTVHSPHDTAYQQWQELNGGDPDAEYTMSFQIVGVTELHEGDYTMDSVLV